MKEKETQELWTQKELKVKQNPFAGIIEIEGIKYSYEFFRNVAGIGECAFNLNEPFKIIGRKDGTITVERIEEK